MGLFGWLFDRNQGGDRDDPDELEEEFEEEEIYDLFGNYDDEE